MWLNKEQDEYLQKIYKETVASKLGLGKKFPRAILYIQQKKLGIGLITPETAVAMLAFKLYIGNKRANSKVAKLIGIIEESITVEYGKNSTDFSMDRLSNNTIT